MIDYSTCNSNSDSYFCIVIGGGIAGVSCVEELCCHLPQKRILVLSASPFVKAVSNLRQVGRALDSFDVKELSSDDAFGHFPNVTCAQTLVDLIDFDSKVVHTRDGSKHSYQNVCLCTGARPNVLYTHQRVIGIRDTQTVEDFQSLLKDARKIMVVGNGGIATEIVYELRHVDIVWVVRQRSISATFVDPGAAEFFLPHLHNKPGGQPQAGAPCAEEHGGLTVTKRMKYGHTTAKDLHATPRSYGAQGSALGPDWASDLHKSGGVIEEVKGDQSKSQAISVLYECELADVVDSENLTEEDRDNLQPESLDLGWIDTGWPIYVRLSNGSLHGCDFVVSATGVIPDVGLWKDATGKQLAIAADGGIPVNDQMQTAIAGVYAAGDTCTAGWDWAPHWQQMRLWTQARQMGAYSARCIAAHDRGDVMNLDICFDIFTHVTTFFGFKVVLLGKYNGQGLESAITEFLLRVTKGVEFVKVILNDGKVCGAILIGETDMEETFENLILNQTDVSHLKEDLLNPSVDIEDYFD